MLSALLAKDLRRALRNPAPYLMPLCVPLVIVGLLGLVFGGRSENGGLGRIKFAVVDEDNSPLTGLLRGALNQDRAAKYLEPVFLSRNEALRQVTNNVLSGALIIPAKFTRDFLLGANPVALELVENPAQAFKPAILEELLRVTAASLNAVKRNFNASLGDWRDILSGEHRPAVEEIPGLLIKTAERFDVLRRQLDPLPVWFSRDERAAKSPGSGAGSSALVSTFAFLLPGLAAMFLLFLSDVAMRDLAREAQQGAFQRFCTLPPGPAIFVASKVVFTLVMALLGAAILLGGGGLIFGIRWTRPGVLAALAAAFAFFASGLLALIWALSAGGRAAEAINNIGMMVLGLASGCAFPANALPEFLRLHVTPLLPPAWFIEAARGVRIPAEFTSNILAGRQSKIEFFTIEGSGDAAAALVELRVARAVIALNSDLIELSAANGHAPATGEAVRALERWPALVALHAAYAGRKPQPSGFNLSLPEMITFGGGLADARLALAVLCGFGLAANGAAVRFFKA